MSAAPVDADPRELMLQLRVQVRNDGDRSLNVLQAQFGMHVPHIGMIQTFARDGRMPAIPYTVVITVNPADINCSSACGFEK